MRIRPLVLTGLFLLELGVLLHLNRDGLARQTDALEADGVANRDYEEAGELLLHRLPPLLIGSVSVRMPVLSLSEAMLLNHASRPARRFWMGAVWTLQLGLLAFRCSFAWAGYGTFDNGVSVLMFYSLPVSLAAAAMAWREQKPDARRSWVVGFCVGFTLLCRSALAFLPLVVGAAAYLRRGKTPRRELAAQLFGLSVLPYLFLVPWLCLNWSLHGKIIPFEHQEADAIVVSGALGVVDAGLHNASAIPDAADSEKGGGVLRWAAGEVLSHPVRYAVSVWERFLLVVGWQPLLFLLAAAGCVLRRRKSAAGLILGLFCLYYVGIHCLMAVRTQYFMPLLPVLVAMLCLLMPGKPLLQTDQKGPGRSGAALAFGACLAAMGAAALYSYYALAGYALRDLPASELAAHLDSELSRSPGDAWLNLYRRRMTSGDGVGDEPAAGDRDSIAALDGLIETSPSNGALWERRGVALGLAGRDLEAIRDLKHAIIVAPTLSAYLTLGTLHSRRKEWREAREAFNEALRSKLTTPAMLIPVIQESLKALPPA
jgi:4-amino-4-deoxy-L-arabinose transferase-like glycosyltransferase